MAQTTAVVPTGPIQDAKKPSKLEDQAAAAALYATKTDHNAKTGHEFLNKNNQLSSAGAAASLKYANPQDLPSYPSSGLKKNDSAAGAAASLGWANQKPFEHWKPDPSASASAAAMLAKDYKIKPLWQPEQSANGAKAALLAHKDGGKVNIWKPEASVWGNSAATLAFKKYGAGESSPVLDYGYTQLGRQGSLLAATGAMSSSRKRAESTPGPRPAETYPDEHNAGDNAMKAAMSVSKKKKPEISSEGGSVPYTNMPKEMYTSHPPVAPEVDELNRQNTLRASAVAMARGIYNQQQKQIDAAKANHASQGAKAAHRRPSNASSDDPPAMYLGNLQEAAQKLAQERLAKLHDDHAKNHEYREYRDYYGSTPPQSRLSIRGRARRRASSDGTLDEDKEQSNKIRAQMSLFSNNLSQVDQKKRAQDREALIAVAQRNVTKSLHGMDEKVFADTGKVAPSLLSEWEVKAHAAAQAKSESRMENYGKVNIGGGKFINQSAIDLVAARNVQPVLDEINEKAALERERQATIKADQDEQQRKTNEKKQREREEKDINKKLRQQDKGEEKAKRAEEKAVRDEEKRVEKEKRRSVKNTSEGGAAVVEKDTTADVVETSSVPRLATIAPTPIRTSMEDQASLRMKENADAANLDESTPMSPSSPKDDSKVKNWLKTKFRRQSRSQKSTSAGESSTSTDKEDKKSFVGGAILTGASANNSTASIGAKSSSIRDVALARKGKEAETDDPKESRGGRRRARDSDVSSLSSDDYQEARDDFDETLAPPPTFPAAKSSSPVRDSKFKEVI